MTNSAASPARASVPPVTIESMPPPNGMSMARGRRDPGAAARRLADDPAHEPQRGQIQVVAVGELAQAVEVEAAQEPELAAVTGTWPRSMTGGAAVL
jgi:hypothetical protein